MNFTLFRITLFAVGTAVSMAACTPAHTQTIPGGTYTGTAGTTGAAQHRTTLPTTGGNGGDGYNVYAQFIQGGTFTGGLGGTGGAGGLTGGTNQNIAGNGTTGANGGNGGNGLSLALSAGEMPVDITGGTFAGGAGGAGGRGGNGATQNLPNNNAGNGGNGGIGGDGLFASGANTIIDISGGTFTSGAAGTGGSPGTPGSNQSSGAPGAPGTTGMNGTAGYGIFVENGATVEIEGSGFSFANGIVTATLTDGTPFTATAFIGPGGGTIELAPSTSAVPEPGLYQTTALLVMSGLGMLRMRRKKANA